MIEGALPLYTKDIQKSACFRFACLLGLYQLEIRLVEGRLADEVVKEKRSIHLKVLYDKQTVFRQKVCEALFQVHSALDSKYQLS